MGVLYVTVRSKARPITFGCVAMRSAVLFIFRYRWLLYSAGSGVNIVQVVLSGFSVRLFCFVHTKTVCRYALCLICPRRVSTYFYFVLWPLWHEL